MENQNLRGSNGVCAIQKKTIRKKIVASVAAGFLVGFCVLVSSGWLKFTSASANGGTFDASALVAGNTETVSSITKDGVTWTFSERVTAGQFVNGDYYVIGPVTITAISPKPTTSSPYLNGSVKNPPTAGGKSGFDSRLSGGTYWFNASLRSYPPIVLKPGDSLISSISLATPQSAPEVMRPTTKSISPVASASVLTVLSAVPPSDAFRPSYCDRKDTIYRAGDLRRNLLPSLAPANPSATPTLAQYEALYRRPWIDTNPFLFDAPADYMPSYGAHIALADSYAGLLLMLNFPAEDKVNLTNYLVQYGIDCMVAWKPAMAGPRLADITVAGRCQSSWPVSS
jgi:hypothetical protein